MMERANLMAMITMSCGARVSGNMLGPFLDFG